METSIISIHACPFFVFSVHQQSEKKKKDLWLIVFWRMLLPRQFFKLFLDKIFLFVYTLPTEVLFISQVCIFTGPSANFIILFSAPHLSLVLWNWLDTQKRKKMDLDSSSAIINNHIVWPITLITFYDSSVSLDLPFGIAFGAFLKW